MLAQLMYLMLGVVCICYPQNGDDDKILVSLSVAKETYNKERSRIRSAIVTELKTKEAKARELGDKKLVDIVKSEIDAFESSDQMPKSISMRVISAQIIANRTTMSKAFRTAIKEYTKAGLDHKADATEAEMIAFLSNSSAANNLEMEGVSTAISERLILAQKLAGTTWTWENQQNVQFHKDGSVIAIPSGVKGTWAPITKEKFVIVWPSNGTESIDIVNYDAQKSTLRKTWLGGLNDKKVVIEKQVKK